MTRLKSNMLKTHRRMIFMKSNILKTRRKMTLMKSNMLKTYRKFTFMKTNMLKNNICLGFPPRIIYLLISKRHCRRCRTSGPSGRSFSYLQNLLSHTGGVRQFFFEMWETSTLRVITLRDVRDPFSESHLRESKTRTLPHPALVAEWTSKCWTQTLQL